MTALVWAIKESLVGYVRGMSDGGVLLDGVDEIQTADGAVAFRFPEASDSDATVRRFRGSVRFTGHDGLMRVKIAHPWVERRGGAVVLTITDPDEPAQRLAFARIAAFDGTRASGTTLTSEGADLFFGPYRDGTPLDDPRLQE